MEETGIAHCQKKDKIGGAPWEPTIYSNLVSITMEMFDLVDIQRVRHPKLRKFTYESKFLKVKSRIDFFLIAKNLTLSVKNTEICPAIAPTMTRYTSFYLCQTNAPEARDIGNLTTPFQTTSNISPWFVTRTHKLVIITAT